MHSWQDVNYAECINPLIMTTSTVGMVFFKLINNSIKEAFFSNIFAILENIKGMFSRCHITYCWYSRLKLTATLFRDEYIDFFYFVYNGNMSFLIIILIIISIRFWFLNNKVIKV